MMKKKYYFFITVWFLYFSCSKSDNICNVEIPEKDLPWLAALIDNYKNDNIDQRVTLYEYNEADVYYIEDCLNCSDALDVIKNCSGIILCEFGGIDGRNTCPDFIDSSTLKEVIYSDL